MLKQRDYYIYAYIPDKKNISESSVKCNFCDVFIFVFAYCFVGENTENKCGARKQEREKEEKYKEEILKAAKKSGGCE